MARCGSKAQTQPPNPRAAALAMQWPQSHAPRKRNTSTCPKLQTQMPIHTHTRVRGDAVIPSPVLPAVHPSSSHNWATAPKRETADRGALNGKLRRHDNSRFQPSLLTSVGGGRSVCAPLQRAHSPLSLRNNGRAARACLARNAPICQPAHYLQPSCWTIGAASAKKHHLNVVEPNVTRWSTFRICVRRGGAWWVGRALARRCA